MLAGAIVAIALMLSALAFVLRIRKFEKSMASSLARLSSGLQERDQHAKEKNRRDELGQLKNDLRSQIDSLKSAIDSLRTAINKIPTDHERSRTFSSQQRPHYETVAPSRTVPAVSFDAYDEVQTPEDGAAQLLAIANRIVQQSSTTLESFRASTDALATRVTAWPPGDGVPVAFLVEHRGTCYAVPNVVKPARLPKEWFNRSEFGVNDEIRQVLSLPRVKRRGDDVEVQDPGVFAR